jgi:hypothetical protein
MSLLEALFGKPLDSAVSQECAAYKNSISAMIRKENQQLRFLGIAPPRLISECGYQTRAGNDGEMIATLSPPQFELPPHRVFVISIDDELVLTLCDDVEKVDQIYSRWGLGDVAQPKYGGVWTNRDPYAFYRELAKKPDCGIYCAKAGDFTRQVETEGGYGNHRSIHDQAKKLKPLCGVQGLSCEEASNVHARVRLYNSVTDYRHNLKYKTFYDIKESEWGGASRIPKDILLELPVPCTWLASVSYTAVKILPSGTAKPGQIVEFLNNLRDINHFLSFELVRAGEAVYFRLKFPIDCKKQIIQKLRLYFPGAVISIDEEPASPLEFTTKWLVKSRVYKSIKRLRDFRLDPFAHFTCLFDNSAASEPLSYQIIFAPLADKSATALKESQMYGNTLLLEPEDVKRLTGKLPLWFVSISASSPNEHLAAELIQSAAATFDTPESNFSEPHSYTYNQSHFPNTFPAFTGMFDTEELSALVHFPVTELPIKRLQAISGKDAPPPETYTSGTSGDVRIGVNQAGGRSQAVTIPEEVRDRHLYIVGKSGTGKSTLMATLIRRDIEAGRGVAVIDPHGDLIHHLLEAVPDYRAVDCILFSPKLFSLSLEILSAETEQEIDLLSDDLITMFRRTSESWGDKMQAILQMAFQTLLRVPGSSFTDITPFLTDENYRNRLLAQIDHPQLASFWQQRYDMRQAEPILIRMDRLTTSGTLRSVLTQNKNSLNFYDVITESKIFLADLSKGFLGESTSHLLGSIIVSQIQLAAMRQAHLPIERRVPFSLFVDEVQNFTTSAFTTILSEARKQKLRLTIAHQFVSQLPGDIQKAVFGNVGTMMFFALSPDDLGAARHELGSFEPSDVANLPKYHALCRPATAARDTFSFVTDAPQPTRLKNNSRWIVEQTKRKYGSVTDSANSSSKEFQGETRLAVTIETPLSGSIQSASKLVPPSIMMPVIDRRCPAPAQPLAFPTNTEKILHFLRHAEYLSQPQIIALTNLQASNASTALKKLVETGQIKSLDDRRPKIYFLGRSANPTTHNLLVRDLFVKINASNFAVRSVKFNDQLADLNPDLTVEFLSEDGAPLPAYFELDRGTEGVGELARKAERYARLTGNPRVCFVFERETDMLLARKTIEYPFITYAPLNQFTTLNDHAFSASARASADNLQLPFFR